MEGGLITTDDEYYYQMLLCLRSHGWTRHLPEDNVLKAKVSSFEFIYPGYNVRPTEIQAAIGLEQLKKLPEFVNERRKNAQRFPWDTQKEVKYGKSSWFGFSIVDKHIEKIKKTFDRKGIQYRPIMSHFTKSPSIKYFDYEIYKDLSNADYVYEYGIFMGNHHWSIDWKCLT